MASPTQWTWVWVDSGSWWWTGRPGVLRFIGLQRVGHDWVTELNWQVTTSTESLDFPSYSINLSSHVNIHDSGYIILLWDGVLSSVGTHPPFPKHLVRVTCHLPWGSHFISSSCSVPSSVLCSATLWSYCSSQHLSYVYNGPDAGH